MKKVLKNPYLLVAMLFAFIGLFAIAEQLSLVELGIAGSMILANGGVLVGLPRRNDISSGALRPKDKILIALKEDIAFFPDRDDKGVLILGDILFKPGKSFDEFYGTQNTIKINSVTEGETDQEGERNKVMFEHPGTYLEVLEFRQLVMRQPLVVIVQRCNEDMIIYGDCCNPMRMAVDANGDNAKNSTAFTFTNVVPGHVPGIYRGAVTLPDFAGLVAANATSVSIANGNGRYKTGINTQATQITTITGSAHGMVISLVGNTGGFPSTVQSGGIFILKDGATFTLTDGAQITFKVFKDGANTFKFIEQSRKV